MPEVSIKGKDVPLKYFNPDPNVIGAIKKFRPFTEWASSLNLPKEVQVEEVAIQNVDWVGKRIEGVKFEVALRSVAGRYCQSVTLTVPALEATSRVGCLVLPMSHRSGEPHVLLRTMPAPLALVEPVSCAITGAIVGKEFAGTDADVLRSAGIEISPSDLVAITPGGSSNPINTGSPGSPDVMKLYHCLIRGEDKLPIKGEDGSTYEWVQVDSLELRQNISSSNRRHLTDGPTLTALLLHQSKE